MHLLFLSHSTTVWDDLDDDDLLTRVTSIVEAPGADGALTERIKNLNIGLGVLRSVCVLLTPNRGHMRHGNPLPPSRTSADPVCTHGGGSHDKFMEPPHPRWESF